MPYRYFTYTDPETKKPNTVEWGGSEEESAKAYEEFRTKYPQYIGGEMKVSPTQLDISTGSPVAVATRVPRKDEVPSSLSALKTQLSQSLTSSLAGHDKTGADIAATKAQERTDALALLDANIRDIELRTQQKIEGVREQETRRLGEARGINIRAGLGGSPFAGARKEEIRTKTGEIIGGYRELESAEKAKARGEINTALTAIEERARTRIETAEKERMGVIEKGISFLESNKKGALENLTMLSKSGMVDWTDISQSGILDELKTDTDYSDDLLKFIFKANEPKSTKIFSGFQGDNFVYITQKPDGTVSTETFSAEKLGIPKDVDPYITTDDEGNVWWADKNALKTGGSVALQKLGQVAETSGGQLKQLDTGEWAWMWPNGKVVKTNQMGEGVNTLPESSLREASVKGIPDDVAKGVWTDVRGNFSREQIKQNLIDSYGADIGQKYFDAMFEILDKVGDVITIKRQ